MAGRAQIRELYEASYRRLVLEMLAHTDGLSAAEQAARDAFAAACRRGRDIEGAADPYASLRSMALDAVRRRRRRESLLERLRLRRRPSAPAPEDPRLLPESRAALDAVTALPSPERETLVLRHLGDIPVTEIAEAAGAPPDDVQSGLAAARAVLEPVLAVGAATYRGRLDDLARDLRQAIGLPDFSQVLDAAARRRVQLFASVGGIGAVVAAVVVVSVGWPSSDSPQPTDAQRAATAGVRAALAEPGTTMYAVAENADGVAATFWYCQSCASERSFALLSEDGFLHVRVVALSADGQGDAWAAPGGDFVVSSARGDLEVVSPDGVVRDVHVTPGANAFLARGDELVITAGIVARSDAVTLVVDTQRAQARPLFVDIGGEPGINLIESFPGGDLWGTHPLSPDGRWGLVHSADGGGSWPERPFDKPGHAVWSPIGYPLVSESGTVGFLAISLRNPNGTTSLWLSSDEGATWRHVSGARAVDGRPIGIYSAGLAADGTLIATGLDADGRPQVWRGTRGIESFHALRSVLEENVTLARPPLDRPDALWATAPRAIWESDDNGRTWFLLASHLTWQNLVVER